MAATPLPPPAAPRTAPPQVVPPPEERLDEVVAALERDGYCVAPGFFSAEQIRHLAADAQQRLADGEFRRAAVGRGDERTVRSELRSDFVLWLDEATATPAEGELLQTFEALRLAVNRRLYLGLLTFEGHLAHYPPGACYGRHLDQFRGVESRILTVIVYLNEDWQEGDGGQLRLYLGQSADSPYLDVLPAAGTLVSFLSGVFYHEVLPARRGRLSLTGWFRRRD